METSYKQEIVRANRTESVDGTVYSVISFWLIEELYKGKLLIYFHPQEYGFPFKPGSSQGLYLIDLSMLNLYKNVINIFSV